jgi:hypothetical protein
MHVLLTYEELSDHEKELEDLYRNVEGTTFLVWERGIGEKDRTHVTKISPPFHRFENFPFPLEHFVS